MEILLILNVEKLKSAQQRLSHSVNAAWKNYKVAEN